MQDRRILDVRLPLVPPVAVIKADTLVERRELRPQLLQPLLLPRGEGGPRRHRVRPIADQKIGLPVAVVVHDLNLRANPPPWHVPRLHPLLHPLPGAHQ